MNSAAVEPPTSMAAMTRFMIAAFACLAGCSRTLSPLPADPGEVVGATVQDWVEGEIRPVPIPLSTDEARNIYKALKSSERHKESENGEIPWGIAFTLTFDTLDGHVSVTLDDGLYYWRPMDAGANVNYPVPESALALLSKHIEPSRE